MRSARRWQKPCAGNSCAKHHLRTPTTRFARVWRQFLQGRQIQRAQIPRTDDVDDVAVVDRFLDVFSRYIDSGFGLLGSEVRFLSATLIAIDVTLAGLFWAMGHASAQGDEVMARLIRKVLYVGAFAYILGHFNQLAGIVFRSFAGLGLIA